MDKISVTVQNHEGKDVVLRLGEAEKIVHPLGINITGILGAPNQFRVGKTLDPSKCHLQIEKDKGTITLIILDTDPHSKSTVVGKLKKDGYFSQWEINSERRWKVSEFVRHIKMYRSFFSEPSECDSLVRSLQQWGATIETVLKEHNDQTGNSLSMLERKVNTVDLKRTFSLTIPLFQGYPKQKFTVEIGLDPQSTAVLLYLFSQDLFTLEIEHREKLIEDELNNFNDFNCSKVVLS